MIKKFRSFLSQNILFVETLFLLAFIPLFPKVPLVDVRNTWVSVRFEDFLVLFVLLSWLTLLIRKKITIKTPLTIPLLTFWLIGAIATIHGVLLVFPTIANIFPNVAFLSLVRHIEYMSVFFIAYEGMKDKNFLKFVIVTLIVTFLGVVFYGFGQKYAGLPAYLTMNEEFAKGVPIYLSNLSRISSTFAGHYDLAAYLVLIIPMLVSLVFGIKNWIVKIGLSIASLLGLILLFMTVSRVSFFVLFFALAVVIFFQKRKLILILVPLVLIFGFIFITIHPSSLLNRFKSTVTEIDVVVDAKSGESLGHVNFVDKEYFKDKVVLKKRAKDKVELAQVIAGQDSQLTATPSALLPYKFIPNNAPLINAVNVSNGEDLPQGTGYVNLVLSPVVRRIEYFFYELPPDYKSSPSAQVIVINGDFVVKRAAAYDLSLTTRTQGEWPRAIEAFTRNIIFGSGYGSVSLAVDNNYLRILGEVGSLGFVSFFGLFLILGIYIKKIYQDIDSPLSKSFVIGFGAGVVGLALNATLIDVFEASKIAFVLWLLMGITFGLLSQYRKKDINILYEIKRVATSSVAMIIYLLLICVVLFSPTIDNFFVGDDYAWLRWAADCSTNCDPISRIASYFTSADGFFYRPGTKIYFYIMYSRFWLNQAVYHLTSLSLHFMVAVLFFFLAKRVLKDKTLAFFASLTFLVMSGFTEAIFWISSTGYLFNAFFGLLGLLLFSFWEEKKKIYYLLGSIISISLALLFHELGVVYPLLIVLYSVFKEKTELNLRHIVRRVDFLLTFIPVGGYLLLRYLAASHWSGGDYSYNLVKLPFNLVGNILGYISLIIGGQAALPIYEKIRDLTRQNIPVAILAAPLIIVIVLAAYRLLIKYFDHKEVRVVLFGLAFFAISLLPFLGLGNIASRYSYLASLGLILILVMIVKKIHTGLLDQGREISLGVVGVLVAVFMLFHIIQVQQSYFEWQDGGNKVKRFFVSFEAAYKDYWSGSDVEFHFVNVPQRLGGAWIFPVGLDHATWFAIKNSDAKVFVDKDLNTALLEAGNYQSRTVFVFNDDGSVSVIDRLKNVPSNLIIPPQ